MGNYVSVRFIISKHVDTLNLLLQPKHQSSHYLFTFSHVQQMCELLFISLSIRALRIPVVLDVNYLLDDWY